jgi:hypothetical protein
MNKKLILHLSKVPFRGFRGFWVKAESNKEKPLGGIKGLINDFFTPNP